MNTPREIKDKSKGGFEDSITWTEFRGTTKAKTYTGRILERLEDGCYRVERTEIVQRTHQHIVHFEKVDRIDR